MRLVVFLIAAAVAIAGQIGVPAPQYPYNRLVLSDNGVLVSLSSEARIMLYDGIWRDVVSAERGCQNHWNLSPDGKMLAFKTIDENRVHTPFVISLLLVSRMALNTLEVAVADDNNRCSDKIVVYPNPVNGVCEIKGIGNNSATLMDISGRKLRVNRPDDNGVLHLDFSSRPSGFYLLVIKSPDGTTIAERKIAVVE